MIGEFKIVDRPITRLPEKLIKSLEKTRRDGSAISIDVTGMTERSAKRLAESAAPSSSDTTRAIDRPTTACSTVTPAADRKSSRNSHR